MRTRLTYRPLQYYPVYKENVDLLRKRMVSLIGKFYREYGRRYKEKKYIYIHPRHHRFLAELHSKIYVNQLKPQGKTVQYNDIKDYVERLSVANVLYLLNYIHDDEETESTTRRPMKKNHLSQEHEATDQHPRKQSKRTKQPQPQPQFQSPFHRILRRPLKSSSSSGDNLSEFPKLLKKKVIVKKVAKPLMCEPVQMSLPPQKAKEPVSVTTTTTKPILKRKGVPLTTEKPKVNLCQLVEQIQKQRSESIDKLPKTTNTEFTGLVLKTTPSKIPNNKIKLQIKSEQHGLPPQPPKKLSFRWMNHF